jgi:hypothetical protein
MASATARTTALSTAGAEVEVGDPGPAGSELVSGNGASLPSVGADGAALVLSGIGRAAAFGAGVATEPALLGIVALSTDFTASGDDGAPAAPL